MKNAIIGAACAALLCSPLAALAKKQPETLKTINVEQPSEDTSHGASVSVRGSAGLGFYDGHSIDSMGESSDGGNGIGLGTGATLNWGRWFGDLGIDYYKVSKSVQTKFDRTDLTATGGMRLNDWLVPFGGVRLGWQGDSGVFKDNIWKESGIFVGSALTFPIGQGDLRGGVSLAYNLNKIDDGVSKLNYNGLSGKIRVSIARTPHAFELRFQNFKGTEGPDGLCETYAFLTYVFNWKVLDF